MSAWSHHPFTNGASSDDAADTRSRQSTDGSTNARKTPVGWECSTCTLPNSGERGECSVCHAKRPMQAPPVVGFGRYSYREFHSDATSELSSPIPEVEQEHDLGGDVLHDPTDEGSYTEMNGGEKEEYDLQWKYIFEFRTKVCQRWLAGDECDDYTCFDTHATTPSRRVPRQKQDALGWNYSWEKCSAKSEEECPRGAMCRRAHSEDETLYHPLMYRTKLCARPKKDPLSPYCTLFGPHCAHAHSPHLLRKPRQPAFLQQEQAQPRTPVSGEVLSEEQRFYYMFEYKTQPCLRPVCQCGQICDSYHTPVEKRRSPRDFHYTEHPCANVKTPGPDSRWGNPDLCPEGDQCHFAHTRLEQMYHPHTYKTSLCNRAGGAGGCAWGERCSHAHGSEDLSKPERSLALAEMGQTFRSQPPASRSGKPPPARRPSVTAREVPPFPRDSMQRAPAPMYFSGPPPPPLSGKRVPSPGGALPPTARSRPPPGVGRGGGAAPAPPAFPNVASNGLKGGRSSPEDLISIPENIYVDLMKELDAFKKRDYVNMFMIQCPMCNYERRRDTALVGCGHVLCHACANKGSNCLVCRQRIEGLVPLQF